MFIDFYFKILLFIRKLFKYYCFIIKYHSIFNNIIKFINNIYIYKIKMVKYQQNSNTKKFTL